MNHGDRVRVAVVGCGAVAREFHIPVLAGHKGVQLTALVDRDRKRAAQLAEKYGVRTVLSDVGELDKRTVDAAVVATPPQHHAPCSIALMHQGIHVLVEKPMSITVDDAKSMVRMAEGMGVVLTVGLIRRLFPSTRLLKSLVTSGTLGEPTSFDAEQGGLYRWPLATLDNLRRPSAGGGALIDTGTHILDRLLWIFGGDAEILDYRDNSLGGVESDCVALLRLRRQGRSIDGRMEISRTRVLRNSLRVEFENAVVEVAEDERYRVRVRPHGRAAADGILRMGQSHRLEISWDDEPPAPFHEVFRAVIDDWLEAIRSGRRPELWGQTAISTVELIESCYRRAQFLHEPGFNDGPEVHNGEAVQSQQVEVNNKDSRAIHSLSYSPKPSKPKGARKRVLITGATGFIGCRLAEILHLRGEWEIRALVRDPSTAARLARLPIDMVVGDVRSKDDVRRAVDGCDTIVHCAVGKSWGRRREIMDVTVHGTKNVGEAALASGAGRFIHLSSIAIHGNDVQSIVNESTPIRPDISDDYGESKALAEQVIQRLIGRGLRAVILRPACVYGPFDESFVVSPVLRLIAGRLVVVGGTPSNTVYVDNVVHAIVRAMEASEGRVEGQTLTIGGDDNLTWDGFFGYFAQYLGLELPVVAVENARGRAVARRDRFGLDVLGSWYRDLVDVIGSAEFRGLTGRILRTQSLGSLPRLVVRRYPGLKRRLNTSFVYRRRETEPMAAVTRPLVAVVTSEKARRVLGYEEVDPAPGGHEADIGLATVREDRP